jgi:hypothetical protein
MTDTSVGEKVFAHLVHNIVHVMPYEQYVGYQEDWLSSSYCTFEDEDWQESY